MRSSLLLASLLAVGCATAGGVRNESAGRPEPAANDEVMRDDTPAQSGTLLSVTLDATPEIRIGREGDQLDLTVRVTNQGDEPISSESLAAQLHVDDMPGVGLDFRGHDWTILQPGESAEWHERNLGVRLFDEPGEHTLRLEVEGAVSAPVGVVVSGAGEEEAEDDED